MTHHTLGHETANSTDSVRADTLYGHIPELDGARAMSILFVLASHMLPLGPSEWRLNATSGFMGMSMFFCLSGFLITRFLHRNDDIRVFMVRRLARIVPLAVVYAFCVSIIIFYRPDTFLSIVLFYKNYADHTALPATGHLWSLCVEVHFYLAIGVAVAIFGRRGFWLIPVAILAVLLLRIDMGIYGSIRTHFRVDEILAGCLLALVWLYREHPASRFFVQVSRHSFWLFLALWFLSCHPLAGPMNYARPYMTLFLVGSLLFMADGPIRWAMRTSVLRYIALTSYALYVWHPMTMLGWLGSGDGWTKYLLHRPISFAATFLLAHLSTFTFERYITRLARRYKGRRREAND